MKKSRKPSNISRLDLKLNNVNVGNAVDGVGGNSETQNMNLLMDVKGEP